MTGPELQSLLHLLTPISAANIDQTLRALRHQGLVPTSPRGTAAVHLDAVHAAWALLALAIDQSPDKSADAVPAWGRCRRRMTARFSRISAWPWPMC